MCSFCHEDISAAFSASPHGVIESVAKGRWEARGCEACHGTGGEHSETMEPENILGFKSEFTDDANRACLACHQGDSTHRGRLFGSHNRNSLNCLECHSVHQPAARPLLAVESDQLCTKCHAGERADFNGSNLNDDGPALSATFGEPRGLAIDALGSVYIADAEDPVIKTWQRILPNTFLPLSKMPQDIR